MRRSKFLNHQKFDGTVASFGSPIITYTEGTFSMKNYRFTQLLSAILAGLILLSSLAMGSCSNNFEDPGNEKGSKTNTIEIEIETDPVQEALDNVRSVANWDGKEWGILYANDISGYAEEVEAQAKVGTDTASAVINDAVFERNTLFEEYGNLTFVLIPTSHTGITTQLQIETMSPTRDFQFVSQTTTATAGAATSGYLFNYLELDIDYEQVWWDQGTLDFALEGCVFFMDGPFNIVDDDVTFVMMFNKTLQSQYGIENPYDTVKRGEWTLDYFNSVVNKLSTEDGDGKWDENDTYGFATPRSIGETFFYGANLKYVENSRNTETPELSLTEARLERAFNTITKARRIIKENNSTYVAAVGEESLALDIFMDERALYYVEAASYLRTLNSGMEGEYGVIPIPKYDKDQEKYTTWRHGIGSTLSMPTSIGSYDLFEVANILELYAILSQKYVRPAYYDTMLTTRNVRDVESSEMLDLIFQNRIYDMAMYFESLGFASLFSNSVVAVDTFASSYSGVSRSFDKKMRYILENLK